MLLVYVVLISVPIGYLAGGKIRNMKNVSLHLLFLPCIAFLLEASFAWIPKLTNLPPSAWLGWIVCLEYLLLAAFIWANRRLKGIKLLGLSTLVNFIVIAANDFRMPITPVIHNYPKLAHFVQRIQTGDLPEYVLVDWDGPLWFLGDTIPLGNGLASIGDLLMAAAILVIIISMMKTRKKRKKRRTR